MTLRLIYLTIISLALLTFTSCSFFSKSVKLEEKTKSEEANLTLYAGNKSIKLGDIKANCTIVDSIQDKIPKDFAFVDFFQIFLTVKSYKPEYLKYFGCSKKLENIGTYFLAFDREPLPSIDFNSSVDSLTIHREIIRNLYKAVGAVKDPSGKYLRANGLSVTEGNIYETSDQIFLEQLADTKVYFKYHSYLDEQSGTYHEFFIPLKNHGLIKEYLLKLNEMGKTEGNNFGIAYSAMLYLLAPETQVKKSFAWIDEINNTPYYSVSYPLINFMVKDKTLDNDSLVTGYGFNFRLSSSGILLANLLRETGILPKNFSAIPIIDKSLESGSREYCGTVKNAADLLVIEKLYNNQLKIPKPFLKHCIQPTESTSPKTKKFMLIPGSANEFVL